MPCIIRIQQVTRKSQQLATVLREGSRTQRVGSPASLKTVAGELEQVRQSGFATAGREPIPGINAISAPVFDHSGQLQLAITVIGPVSVLPLDPDGSNARALLDVTGRLSAELGYDAARARVAVAATGSAAKHRQAQVEEAGGAAP